MDSTHRRSTKGPAAEITFSSEQRWNNNLLDRARTLPRDSERLRCATVPLRLRPVNHSSSVDIFLVAKLIFIIILHRKIFPDYAFAAQIRRRSH